MTAAGYYAYWGKAQPDGHTPSHLLVYHMLDVAAVCRAFLERDRRITTSIARSAGFDEGIVRDFLPFLLALHDLGKFAESFQDLRPEIVTSLRGARTPSCYSVRHDRLGYLLWSDGLCRSSWEDGWRLATCRDPSGWDFERYRDAVDPWFRATTGHHGEPPGRDAYRTASQSFSARAFVDALEFVRDLTEFLRPGDLRFDDADSAEEALNVSAWSVAGLAVLCDWIGSNQAYFPYCTDIVTVAEYWSRSVVQAETAVKETGVLPHRASSTRGMGGLFPGLEPSPLQKAVEAVPISDGPQLVIVEEVTGSGKTEASVVLAQRYIGDGRADGLYVALPTMATANGMYGRVSRVYDRLFEDGKAASLVLAHSARHLEDGASDHCTVWLADRRKKALLAQVGVGTIDQALLAVLPAKHSVLRLLGLQRNVLIVDEVHAYDSYVARILERLLEFHAALGGSAILLSATLPQSMRQRYVNAFSKGIDKRPPQIRSDSYPLLTRLDTDGVSETPLETRGGSRRTVAVDFIETTDSAMATIEAAVLDGNCVCWIRNSVNDAVEAYEALRARIGDAVTLFHARFMFGDRIRIEQDVVNRFGVQSGHAERAGRVVIATQVVEQSLDLDFDVMVSDLAPIDLLIQRAGRIQRHPRSSAGDVIHGDDERAAPVLKILAPAWSDEPAPGWLSSSLPRTARVYGHVGQLWHSMKILRERGSINVPDEARLLVESVYGIDADNQIPPGLRKASDQFEGDQKARSSVAGFNTLVVRDGYKRTPAHWIDDTVSPTRLSEPATTLRLAARAAASLRPLFEHDRHPWDMSQVSVRRAQIAGRAPATPEEDALILRAHETMRDKGKWSVTLVVEPSDHGDWRGRAVDSSGNLVTVRYDRHFGLLMEKGGS